MKTYKKLLSLLLCVLLACTVSLSVSAGSAIDKVDKESFAESLSGNYWHNANEDVVAENGKIVFGELTSEYTKLISTVVAEKTDYYENVVSGKTVINFKSLPSGVTFIMGFALASVESASGEPGNVEIEFTNKGGVCAAVKAYDDGGVAKTVASSHRVGSLKEDLTLEFTCCADGRFTLSVNGAAVCTAAKTGSDFLGRFGFMQNGPAQLEISDVDVTIYNYDLPENTNIVENFDDGEFNANELTMGMTAISVYPTQASIGDWGGQKALIWKNCGAVYLSTLYKYSNVMVEYDVLWQENSLKVEGETIVSQKTPAHSVRFGCEASNNSSTAAISVGIGGSNRVTGPNGAVWQLKDIKYSDEENAGKGYSVKITVINNVTTVYLKWKSDTEWTEIGHTGKEDGVTPNGFVQITSGAYTNVVFDNLKITNLDAKPNLVTVDFATNRFYDTLKDAEYIPLEVVYMETKDAVEEATFNFYLITAAAGAVAVLGVGVVLLITLIKKKKALAAENAEAVEPTVETAENTDEKAGETADE